ncbi:MBL fold metallo-hydrolase [Natronolimnobius sp. AArcel1]|uniref:MBL fold metallo-hydrolase n=1 Tax=Natronolimnobius sp. AArcel1 TaxID=1679093 RepID=UPI0013E9CA7C|nr:MBL fold metallo-hydrolase [Natronolimnobius sp. AArcel1]NGM69684.1 MBL fold metallo-hydrolase [Natronolimnobius sp. AArcel1]
MDIRRCPVPTTTRAPGGETNAYVLGSDSVVLVDPVDESQDLDRLLADRSLEHILVTHTHPDHVGGVGAYAERTDATVWARHGRVERFRAATGVVPDRTFLPGTTLEVGGERIRILDAPGHAPDHIALEAGPGGPICCGDCAVREGSVVVGAPEGDMRAYVSTLRRLWARDPPALYPGHGPVIDQPRAVLERLLAHRTHRETRILEAVRDGAETLEELLEAAYEKDLTGVRDLAQATVVAHLEKLAVEGRLEWDGECAQPVMS